MIFTRPADSVPIDQGDIIDGCPLSIVETFDVESVAPPGHLTEYARIYVLTQTCDLVQQKASNVVVATVLDAAQLVAGGILKPAEVRGNIRAGRVHGWYFLPRSLSLGIPNRLSTYGRSIPCDSACLGNCVAPASASPASNPFTANTWPSTLLPRTAASGSQCLTRRNKCRRRDCGRSLLL